MTDYDLIELYYTNKSVIERYKLVNESFFRRCLITTKTEGSFPGPVKRFRQDMGINLLLRARIKNKISAKALWQ